jgi:(p)ppGpp synthase/HD superfamily hydrolase
MTDQNNEKENVAFTHKLNLAAVKLQKLELVLKYYMLGKGYTKALRAFAISKKIYDGQYRKDKVTPTFMHMVEIALQVITLKDLLQEEDCLIIALLHDAYEDGFITLAGLRKEFGKRITSDLACISKMQDGTVRKSDESYYYDMSINPRVIIVKGCDRCNNLKTMIGTFTFDKQVKYIDETKHHTLPAMKHGKGMFPALSHAIQNIVGTLNLTCTMVEELHNQIRESNSEWSELNK